MPLGEVYSETGFFRNLFKHVFRIPYFRKYISYQCFLFLENVQNLMSILKMQRKKIEIKFVVSERIASELAALNCLY